MPRKSKAPKEPTKGLLVLTEKEQGKLEKLLAADYDEAGARWNSMRRVNRDAKPGDTVRNRQKEYRVLVPQAGGDAALVQNIDTGEISEINIGYFTYTEPRITVELQAFRLRVQSRRANEIKADIQERLKLEPTVENYTLLVAEYWDEFEALRSEGTEKDRFRREILASAISVIKSQHNGHYTKRRTIGGFTVTQRSTEPGSEISYEDTLMLPPEASQWDTQDLSGWLYPELADKSGLDKENVYSIDHAVRKTFEEKSGYYLLTFIDDRRHLIETEVVAVPSDWELMVDKKIEDKEPLAIVDGWL